MPIQIQKEKILLVEGKDEVTFLNVLLESMNIKSIQIFPVGGKYNFPNEIPLFVKHSEFYKVKQIGCIRDADGDNKAALDSVFDCLKNNGLNPVNKVNEFSESNPSIGIFIMPGNGIKKGALEDLCLLSIDNKDRIQCMDNYIECIENKTDSNLKKVSKRKVQIYLAGMKDICNSIGLGAEKKYWNFDSEIYDELKSFLKRLSI